MVGSTACGGGGTTIELGDKTPEVASAEIADAICDEQVECGEIDIECMSTEAGLDCTGTIEPVDYNACYAELQPDIQSDLAACDLTDAEKTTVEDCLNALLARPCITQSELDAYVAAIEAGDETATLGEPIPASCEQVDAIFENCAA
ncbi:MAG TPA: hypothetical protein VML75_26505 [Kofleriaceae bacterium]|nr:hypothetical protein [Kofleriaceae bacterium]